MIKIKTSVTDINIQYFIDNKVHDNETKNRIYDWEEFFRSRLILKLNEFFGNNWRLDFTQTPEDNSWLVDIFCDDLKTALQIKHIVIDSLDDFKIEAFYNSKGI